MKSAIIKTNDILAYIAFFAVAIIGAFTMISGNVMAGLGIAVGGWVVCSLIFGCWFVLSDIAGNVRKIAERK